MARDTRYRTVPDTPANNGHSAVSCVPHQILLRAVPGAAPRHVKRSLERDKAQAPVGQESGHPCVLETHTNIFPETSARAKEGANGTKP